MLATANFTGDNDMQDKQAGFLSKMIGKTQMLGKGLAGKAGAAAAKAKPGMKQDVLKATGRVGAAIKKNPRTALGIAGGTAGGMGAGAMLSGGNEKRANGDMAEAKAVAAEAKREGEDPQVETAEHLIKGDAKVNEVLPKVDKDKRDDVLKELREDKEEKTASHYPNGIEKTASLETKIGEGIGWQ